MGSEVNAYGTALEHAEGLTSERLAAANINPVSRLATDYLNHFNEVIMLLEMLPQMPECVDDILDWRPCSYRSHFEASGFKDRDLAILAYETAPPDTRTRFDATIEEIDRFVTDAQRQLAAGNSSDTELHEHMVMLVAIELRPLISRASAIVNGAETTAPLAAEPVCPNAQAAVDELFG